MWTISLVLENRHESWQWRKRNTAWTESVTLKIADTPKNQVIYPQRTAQRPGLGFLIAILGQLLSRRKASDVVVADRPFCDYWLIVMLLGKECMFAHVNIKLAMPTSLKEVEFEKSSTSRPGNGELVRTG